MIGGEVSPPAPQETRLGDKPQSGFLFEGRADPEISLIFAHGVGSLKELWDVPCPSRGGVVPTHSAREALRALLLDVVSIQ